MSDDLRTLVLIFIAVLVLPTPQLTWTFREGWKRSWNLGVIISPALLLFAWLAVLRDGRKEKAREGR